MDWHVRFAQQAFWTSQLRRHLFAQVKQEKSQRLLEVGCGTGAVLSTLETSLIRVFGLDINRAFLQRAAYFVPDAVLTQGDGHYLPYNNDQFDIVIYHFTLLWVKNPLQVLVESKRITKPGGWVMALAEPDYGGRIDFPDVLAKPGHLQEEALHHQGADTRLGRKLKSLFHQAGLCAIEAGVINGRWFDSPSEDAIDQEWAVLESDLEGGLSSLELSNLRKIDHQAWRSGERLLFVPTFYAIGQIK